MHRKTTEKFLFAINRNNDSKKQNKTQKQKIAKRKEMVKYKLSLEPDFPKICHRAIYHCPLLSKNF